MVNRRSEDHRGKVGRCESGEHQAHALWVNPGLRLTQDIERAGMKSSLFRADWQFQSPTENKRFAG